MYNHHIHIYNLQNISYKTKELCDIVSFPAVEGGSKKGSKKKGSSFQTVSALFRVNQLFFWHKLGDYDFPEPIT